MSTITVASEELYERAEALHDTLAAMPETAANEALRIRLRAEMRELDELAAEARRRERRLAAEINAAADRVLTPAPVVVEPVEEYMRSVESVESGVALMDAGVGSGQCRRMWLYKATTPETGQVAYWVVDTKGGRKLCKLANRLNIRLSQVDSREAPVRVVA